MRADVSRSIELYGGTQDAGPHRDSSKDWQNVGSAAGLIPFRSGRPRKPRSTSSCPEARSPSGRPSGSPARRSSRSVRRFPAWICPSVFGSSRRSTGGRFLTVGRRRSAPSGRFRPRSTGSGSRSSRERARVPWKRLWILRRTSRSGRISNWMRARSGSSPSALRVAPGNCRGTGSRPASSSGSMAAGSRLRPPGGAIGEANGRCRGRGRAPPLDRPGPARRPV